MQNVNELIGIINGVDFDGVINSKEIVRLQSWADRNRNFVVDKNQMELIKMVDLALEDHVINDREKQLMLVACDKALERTNDVFSGIYEVNGIIEGIACDGVVNEKEIIRLKEWMERYGGVVRKDDPNSDLFEEINEILISKALSGDEQNELLNLLSEKMQKNKLESKLYYLCKYVKEKKNIGIDFIDVVNNESAIHEIHRRAETNLEQTITSYDGYCENQEIIVVSLTLIALLKYDGNFYDNVREAYNDLYTKYSEQRIEGRIRTILSKYKNQSDSGSRSRIINVALENSIVPQSFLSAYFDFVFDIYKPNFEYDLPEEPYEDFRFVFEGLRNNMLSEGDDISIKVTQKTYKLTAATKQLINRDEGLDSIIKLSSIIVRLIDSRYWNKEVRVLNPYLRTGYEGWEKNLNENNRVGSERKISSYEQKTRWEPKLLIRDNSVILVPPIHRVKSICETILPS